jgi:DNA-binding GntR family transcriptional regulator
MVLLAKPIARTFLADSVYETLLENILSGALPSGRELSEVGLAHELHVSRTPVHEALGRLSKDGLVEQTQSKKPRVARFTRTEIAEIYELRKLLEVAAAERAALHMTEPELSGLRRLAADLARNSSSREWPRRALDFDLRFHDAIARAAKNGRLRAEVARYRLLVRAFCRITGSPENLKDAFREHEAILRALEARDPEAAGKAMASHIDARVKVVLREIYPEVTAG